MTTTLKSYNYDLSVNISNTQLAVLATGCVLVNIGCLALVLRKRAPKIIVDFTDAEKDALSKKNLETIPDMPLITGDSKLLNCYDPATAGLLGRVKIFSKEEVNATILKALKAQKSWKNSSFSERKMLMKSLLNYYTDPENQKKICLMSSRDSGKTRFEAMLGEIVPTCEKLRWIINEGESCLKPEYRSGQSIMTTHKYAMVEYHPLGVLGVLAPFNYPCHNLINHIISGLFAGNGVVIKVSEHTSFSADFLIRPVKVALQNMGYDPDLVNVVTGLAETGKSLVENIHISKVIFTGSDAVGKLVMKGASENLTPVVLELGGKDPFIICADILRRKSDLEWVKNTAMRGVFQNAGQNCIGIERIFVEKTGYETFIKAVQPAVESLRQGVPSSSDNFDIGPVCVKGHLKYLQSLIDDAVSKGAKLICGGKTNQKLLPGAFFEPTLIVDVTPEMDLFHKEAFGPIMTVIPWSSEEELIKLVNDCDYALGSGVFSFDYKRAKRIADAIDSAMTNINDFGVNYLCQCLPFGGVKKSGFGRFGGPEGLRACCKLKSITRDRFPFVRTSLPKPYIYPVADNAEDVSSNLIGFAYGSQFLARISNLFGLLKGII